eukprot:998796_1
MSTDIQQFKTLIQHYFPQSDGLPTEMIRYFRFHQFHEWNDIVDDIRSGFDKCCCKAVLFGQLNLTETDKRNLYERLTQCLELQLLHTIFQNITKAFSVVFNRQKAAHILALFTTVVRDQQYEQDIDRIKEDVVDDSVIIDYIIDELDESLFLQRTERVHEIVTQGIQRIVQGRSDEFIHQTMIDCLRQHITTHFVAYFKDNAIGERISELFGEVVKKEGFVLDTIREDMEEPRDSVIIQHVIEGIKNLKNHEIDSIEMNIKAIVEGKTNFQKMGKRILKYFIKYRDKTIAKRIWNHICSIMIENNFTFDNLLDYIKKGHENRRMLLNGVGNQNDVNEVIRIINNVKSAIIYFNILLFSYNISQGDRQKTSEVCFEQCPTIYAHVVGMGKEIKKSDVVNSISGKALSIAKAIDFKNGHPWLYWVFRLFSKQRWAKYRSGEEAGLNVESEMAELSYDKTVMLKKEDSYDIHKHWWKDNKFMQWIQSSESPLSSDMAGHIQSALEEVAKRYLPALKCNYHMAPIICDRVNDYALYALGFHDLVHHIKQLMERDLCGWDVAPIQLDCVIFPQMTRDSPSGKSPIKLSRLYKPNVSEKRVYLKLSEEPTTEPTNVDKLCIWNVEDLLRHKKCGYIKNTDYFVTSAPSPNLDDTNALRSCLFGLLERCITVSARNGDKRSNRYIFIIDRRNPQNLKDRTLKQKPIIGEAQHEQKTQQKDWADKIYIIIPKRYRDEEGNPLCICGGRLTKTKRNASMRNTKCCWCDETEGNTIWKCSNHKTDKTYVLCSDGCEKERPEPYGKISSEWHILPESCLGLSKGNILFNPYTEGSIPITMNDALSGYMFGLSYHVLSLNNICAYWYHNTGGTVFQLNDIATGWPQWFDKINGKKQALSDSICRKIAMRNALPNTDLEGFEREIDKCDEWECPPSDS